MAAFLPDCVLTSFHRLHRLDTYLQTLHCIASLVPKQGVPSVAISHATSLLQSGVSCMWSRGTSLNTSALFSMLMILLESSLVPRYWKKILIDDQSKAFLSFLSYCPLIILKQPEFYMMFIEFSVSMAAPEFNPCIKLKLQIVTMILYVIKFYIIFQIT